MPALSINETACTRCGLCATACLAGVIRNPQGALPHFLDDDLSRCNVCGHCEAICPSGALAVHDVRLDQASYGDGSWQITAEHLGGYLRRRRSMRRYRDQPVDRASIGELMDVVRFAPTGGNRQGVRWLVIHDTRELRRLTALAVDWMRSIVGTDSPFAARFNLSGMIGAWERGRDYICRDAPHLIVGYAHENDAVARTDTIIALAHLDLIAPSFGLGTCWGGIFQHAASNWEPLRRALDLPPGHAPIHCLMLGYPALQFRRPPRRNPVDLVWR